MFGMCVGGVAALFMLQLCIIGRCTWGLEFFVLFILAPVRSNLCVIDLCTPVLKLLIYLNCVSDELYFVGDQPMVGDLYSGGD